MGTFKVWCPDPGWGEAEEVAVEVSSPYWDSADIMDAESCAEQHAQHLFDHGDPFEQILIQVRGEGQPDVHTFKVIVDFEPTFTAYEE